MEEKETQSARERKAGKGKGDKLRWLGKRSWNMKRVGEKVEI